MPSILVTGSSGLVGSAVAEFFHGEGWTVHGVDNNQRAAFFGPRGDTTGQRRRLEATLPRYRHHDLDVRSREGILSLVAEVRPAAVVHAAAQPSHDLAARIPFDDFDVNAVGTLNVLEAARRSCPEAPFVFLSTNKVYGDGPNRIALREEERRYDFADPAFAAGIAESFPVDRSLHSLFGASKLAADVLVQEYGRYFGMPTCCLRGGCLTGPGHAGVELHGFLSHLVRCCVEGAGYTVFGYQGKQVRDNLHAEDVARFAAAFVAAPRPGEVYNLGGGRENSCSILEAFALAEAATGRRMRWSYDERPRTGDHACYYSDLSRAREHYPGWSVTRSLPSIVEEIARAWGGRGAAAAGGTP